MLRDLIEAGDYIRHAENVRHRWTAEEVELQMRLWEIQLEKSTDRLKLATTQKRVGDGLQLVWDAVPFALARQVDCASRYLTM